MTAKLLTLSLLVAAAPAPLPNKGLPSPQPPQTRQLRLAKPLSKAQKTEWLSRHLGNVSPDRLRTPATLSPQRLYLSNARYMWLRNLSSVATGTNRAYLRYDGIAGLNIRAAADTHYLVDCSVTPGQRYETKTLRIESETRRSTTVVRRILERGGEHVSADGHVVVLVNAAAAQRRVEVVLRSRDSSFVISTCSITPVTTG